MITRKLVAAALGLCMIISVFSQEEEKPETTFKYGGFVKADYLFTQYNYGSYEGPGREFHIPSTIPKGEEQDVYRFTDFNVRTSRFNFDVNTTVNGKKLRSFLELDFMINDIGNQRVSNSYVPRIRHFFLEYGNLLAGQTWTTFMIVTLPDELDFIGATEGVVFNRQMMVRYAANGWQVALENPYVTYSADSTGARLTSETSYLPDLVVRRDFKGDWGNFSVAAIGRQLSYYDADKTLQSAFGGGVTLGGKLKVGSKDDIRFEGTFGAGLGRYLALNFVNSSAVDSEGKMKPISTFNGYLAYLHHWNDKFRSSFSFSFFQASNDIEVAGPNVNDQAYSISGNLLYQPAKNVLFGVEPSYAYAENAGGVGGDYFRVQFTAKYAFSFKTSTGN
jgi:hypothetical protein